MEPGKQNVQVFVRPRPLGMHEKISPLEINPDAGEIRLNSKQYNFDRVFQPQTSQADIYDHVVRPLIHQVLSGFNCTVLAYGQTGTGKTYTMEGDRSINFSENTLGDDDSGIIPRAVGHLFDALSFINKDFNVRVSFLELYNEDIYDLLSRRPIEDSIKLKIFDDVSTKNSVKVSGLEEVELLSKSDIYSILCRGSSRRRTAATQCNVWSSRSHSIFSVIVSIKDTSLDGQEFYKTSKLNLVDLAGSENIARSGAQDKRVREACNINQSLLTLGRVIKGLVEKRSHIPYRESKLTRLLQDSLGGKTKTSIIATVSPSISDLEDTMSTLDYASSAKKITNKPEMIQHRPQVRADEYYETEMQKLKEKHTSEMCEIELQIRNEVAQEFKISSYKMKQLFELENIALKEHYENALQEANETITNMRETITNMQDKITDLQNETSDLGTKMIALQDENMELKTELRLKEELLKDKTELYLPELEQKLRNTIKELADLRKEMSERNARRESSPMEVQQMKKVRKGPPLGDCHETYANVTFADAEEDEILQASNKKIRKNATGRARITKPVPYSGKKNKVDIEQIVEISPSKRGVRVTRSRARKKLDY